MDRYSVRLGYKGIAIKLIKQTIGQYKMTNTNNLLIINRYTSPNLEKSVSIQAHEVTVDSEHGLTIVKSYSKMGADDIILFRHYKHVVIFDISRAGDLGRINKY